MGKINYIQLVKGWAGILPAGTATPLDERFVVETVEDLYTDPISIFGGGSGKVFIYAGLQVYVLNTREVYMYIGPQEPAGDISEGDAKKKENWSKIADWEGIEGIKHLIESELGLPNFNGHDYVDLGLPSGNLWATHNVGAENLYGQGLTFKWGEVEPSDGTNNSWDNYKFGGNDSGGQSKYNNIDGLTVLESIDDAVQVYMGGDWRMPTKEDFEELFEYCNTKLNNTYGYNYYSFVSKTDPTKQVLFPGYCTWCSTLSEENISKAYYLTAGYHDDNSIAFADGSKRYNNYQVKGVIKRQEKYLTKSEAEKTYQPKGDYVSRDEIFGNPNGDVGDAVLVDNETLEKIAVKVDELENYVGTHTPIGMVVIPASHDVYGTGEAGVIALNFATNYLPDTGTTGNTYMGVGQYGVDTELYNFDKVVRCGTMDGVPLYNIDGTIDQGYLPVQISDDTYFKNECPTDPNTRYNNPDTWYSGNPRDYGYVPSPYLEDGTRNPDYYKTDGPSSITNMLSDFDGKGNTEVFLRLATVQGDWKTAEYINYVCDPGYSPAACCCWRYHTIGTNHGDWYLPAAGELGYVPPRYELLRNTLSRISEVFDMYLDVDSNFFRSGKTSTEVNAESICDIYLSNGHISASYKNGTFVIHPFTRMLFSNSFKKYIEDYVDEQIEEKIQDAFFDDLYVDLGLPSGTLWASYNLGANSPGEVGQYFQWGDTEGYVDASYKTFDVKNYKFMPTGSSSNITKYNGTDKILNLEVVDDAAAVQLGDQWRIPSKEDFAELYNWEYVHKEHIDNYNGSGIPGTLITSKSNGNSIFLPCVGYYKNNEISDESTGFYWCNSVGSVLKSFADCAQFFTNDQNTTTSTRYYGLLIRPIINKEIKKEDLDIKPVEKYITKDEAVGRFQPKGNYLTEKQAEETYLSKSEATEKYQPKGDYVTTDTLTDYATKKYVDDKFTAIDSDGYEYVDLGLEDGTLWATCNIGANRPEELGLYFQWGDTDGYKDASNKTFTVNDYKFMPTGSTSNITKYNTTDGLTTLEESDDAATVHLSDKWQMPTPDNFTKLCDWRYVDKKYVENYKGSGISGALFTSKVNGNHIFFPFTGYYNGTELRNTENGYYWSNAVSSSMKSIGQCMQMLQSDQMPASTNMRYYGLFIRPVLKKQYNPTLVDKYITEVAADNRYQPKGDYANKEDVKKLEEKVESSIGNIDFSDYYKGVHQNILDEYDSDTADTYKFVHGTTEDELQLTFTPLSPGDLTVPEAIGDISKGTTAASLNGKPISEILDSILFKTIYPTIVNPSITLGSTAASTVEAGSVMVTNPTYTFNRGTANIAAATTITQTYAGAETSHTWVVNCTGGTANTNAGVTAYPNITNGTIESLERYEPGTYTYKVTVNYSAGALLKTSKGTTPNPMPTSTGTTVTNPCPAGAVTSGNGYQRNVTLPVWIDAGGATYTKQALKNWGAMTFTGVQMNLTSVASPIRIKTPRKINTICSYNEVSGKYDVSQKDFFEVTTETQDVNGKDYQYYIYTWKGATAAAVKYEIITY